MENQKTIRISTRAVYHKVAYVDIQVPSDLSNDKVLEWIYDNEDLFVEELDEKLSKAEYNYGRGLNGDYGFDDDSADSETQYNVYSNEGKIIYGRHC